jgi:hypothetical protein
MGAFERALKRLGLRRRPGAPAAAVDLKVNKRGSRHRHWTAGVSVAGPEHDLVVIGSERVPPRPVLPTSHVDAPMPRCAVPRAELRIYVRGSGGRFIALGEPLDDSEISIRSDRPLSDYAPPPKPEPTPAAPVPFDPVRAWIDVGLAWLRCAHTIAEIPAQLALYHRVRVVGLL